ncbi:MAG: hypothetical protein GY757_44705 [bacterium]|nr:hypothetical protein [bacterium]
MKKLFLVSSIVILMLLLQFCMGHVHTTPVFLEKSADHRVVAVLPFEMIFTGKKPKKLSVSEIQKIEEVESIAFQSSLYRSLSRHYYRVNIQPVKQTNRILDANNIGIRESWEADPQDLAQLLNVDAVIRTRVIKKRYMSNLASFGIEIGSIILNEILDDSIFALFIPNQTKRIKAESVIVNGMDGDILWGVDYEDDADWTLPANAIVQHVTKYIARKLPYR